MIVVKDGMWVDGLGKRIRTNSELYQEAVDKDNARVGKEWDALGTTSGGDPAAVQLALLQGIRSRKLAAKYGYSHRAITT